MAWTAVQTNAIGLISLILAGLSIFASLTVLVLAAILYCDPRARPHLQRFSVYILLHFEFVAIFGTVANILTITVPTNNSTCVASAYLQALIMDVLNSLAALICLNFSVVLFSRNRALNSSYCICLVWIICLAFATPALGLGYYGFDPIQGVCWVVLHTSPRRFIIEAISSWTICLLCAVISIVAASVVIFRLRQRSRRVQQIGLDREHDLAEQHKLSIVLKILVFPLLVLVIDGVVIGTTIASNWAYVPYSAAFISQALLNCPGLLVAIAMFFVDPSFKRALRVHFAKHQKSDVERVAERRSVSPHSDNSQSPHPKGPRVQSSAHVDIRRSRSGSIDSIDEIFIDSRL